MNSHYFILITRNCGGANTQPILARTLSAPRCGWKNWCGGSWVPKLFRESWFYVCKQAACRLWVGDFSKSYVNPIFTVPDMLQNLAIMYGTVKINAALVSFLWNSSRSYHTLVLTGIANRPCNLEVKLWSERFFQAKVCVRKSVLVRQILHQQTK